MKNIGSAVLTAVAVALACTTPAWAGFVNGGFETGDLTGWTTNGGSLCYATTTALPRGSHLGNWNPTEGSYFAYLQAGLGAGVYTMLSQPFSANVGDTLTFDVYFDAGDYLPFNDAGYAKLTGAATMDLYLMDVASVGNYGYDGWTAVSYTFATAGTYQLEFGVANIGDNGLPSAVGADNVYLAGTVIPVPGAALLGVIGVALVGWVKRRLS